MENARARLLHGQAAGTNTVQREGRVHRFG
jgi:hypothetical protein